MLRYIVAAVTLVSVMGCKSAVDSYDDTLVSTVEKSCDECAEMAGITVDQCIALIGVGFTDAEKDCLKAVADRHSSVGPYFDCANDEANEWSSCVDSAGCNEVAIMNCNDIIEGINTVCPLPSGAAGAELAACF